MNVGNDRYGTLAVVLGAALMLAVPFSCVLVKMFLKAGEAGPSRGRKPTWIGA